MIIPQEITEPVRVALAHRRGPDQILGRYSRGANLLVDDLVVYASAGPIPTPAGIRVDERQLELLLTGPDRVRLTDTGDATVVPTRLTGVGLDRHRATQLSEAAASALSGSWFATTPEELSARPAIDLLCTALLTGDQDQLGVQLRTLVGRGIGLTPSGDDAIVGILAAAIAAGRLTDSARTVMRDFLAQEGTQRTTTVSLTTLRCAVDGHFSPALRSLILNAALGSTGDHADTVAAVAAHGHTSGCDALYGVVTGWRHLISDAVEPLLTRS